jgi:hypothetical protein
LGLAAFRISVGVSDRGFWALLLFWRIAQALTSIIPYVSHQRGFAEACSLNPEGRDYLAS